MNKDKETNMNMNMNYDLTHYPYSSRRTATVARGGMVATSQPLASQAGLRVLQQGGNAIDAAIAAAACLTVVEPTSNGIGGDAFAILWYKGQMYGLNASGGAPSLLTLDAVKQRGYAGEMPASGWLPVTVPGAPGAWASLSERFGKLPFAQLMEPAIAYADGGYPVSPELSIKWSRAYEVWKARRESGGEGASGVYDEWFRVFAPNGRAPRPGEMWRSEGHAFALREIAATKGESFYRGELAERIDRYARESGGLLRKEDLAAFRPEWVQPLSVNYRGYDVWELPPNGQGLVALMALNVLNGIPLGDKDSVETYHAQIESLKLAFADGKHYITDPARMNVSAEELLSQDYAAQRRSLIGAEALMPEPGELPKGGTVYLAAADGEGNMISFIQSNYNGFGSGVVVPGTGISLQNRGNSFSLDPAHANVLEPGKRPYHTIIPGFLTKDGEPIGPFGVMGAFMQPQGHLQVISNLIDYKLNPQAALDAPRWQWTEGKQVLVEAEVPPAIAKGLQERGHHIQVMADRKAFGCGQVIWREPSGVLIGGTEPRTDGCIASW
ncbi:gamma-glutamyltransferase family protein [Paenibacillus sp. OV219]|uniref:gamma-glutamyltransferase family protein n=1 Tax=Paenibacillus sp. OV219 TaxID=1884377 RepID=UPI0008D6CA24|nr:gamma-glutamyltransferase family protein [Paenibacillus sp. OV219]SEO54353.1 gamma-glutamyltransferase 2. Threonine peptidase. MEROPS family T03 [Paenibacillus sp. OV219]